MLLNELLIKKLERFTYVAIEISILYSNSETKFVIALASDARSITAKELYFAKILPSAFYLVCSLVNLLGISVWSP